MWFFFEPNQQKCNQQEPRTFSYRTTNWRLTLLETDGAKQPTLSPDHRDELNAKEKLHGFVTEDLRQGLRNPHLRSRWGNHKDDVKICKGFAMPKKPWSRNSIL